MDIRRKAKQSLAGLAKNATSQLLSRALGRRNFARLGRFLWMQARLDVANDIRDDGETRVQDAFCGAAADSTGPMCVFDVGANVGDWSRLLIDAWERECLPPARLVLHAFEPVPDVRRDLSAALEARRHGLGGLHVVASAVSDKGGEATFHRREGGSSSLGLAGSEAGFGFERAGDTLTVPLTTIDAYCAGEGVDRVDLIKIDAEGNDLMVLRGAREMLQSGRIGLAQFEYNQLWIGTRAFLKDVFDLVLPLGYRVGKVTPLGIEEYPAWHYELESFREGNYLTWRGELPRGLPTVRWWLAD